MSKKRKIDEIYNILKQFEQINNPDSFITEFSWLNYLDRLYIYYLGEEEEEICSLLKGLYKLGKKAEHKTVKRVVFHIISLLEMKNSNAF